MSRHSERQARRNDRKPFKLPDRKTYLKEHCLGLGDKDEWAASSKHYISPPKVNDFTKCYNTYNADDIDPLSREKDEYYADEEADNFIVEDNADLGFYQDSGKKKKHRKRKRARSVSGNSRKKLKTNNPRKLVSSSSSEDEGVNVLEKADDEEEPLNISVSVQERRKRFSEILASSSSDSDNEQTPRRQLFRTLEKSTENPNPQMADSDHESDSSRQCASNESTKYADVGSDLDDEELEDEEETAPLESEHGILLSRLEPADQKRSTRHDRVVQKHLNSPAHSALQKLRQQRMMKKQRTLSGASNNDDEKLSSDETDMKTSNEVETKMKTSNEVETEMKTSDEDEADNKTKKKNSIGVDEEMGRQSSAGLTLYSSIDRLPKRLTMCHQQNIHYY